MTTTPERMRERVTEARCWVQSKTLDRVPVVVTRRTEVERREKNAFDLGRDCGMSDAARLIRESVNAGAR